MSGEGTISVEVSLLGQRMTLKTDRDRAHMERVAAFVKRRVDEVGARTTAPAQQVALLAALNIADDYLRALDESREFRQSVVAKSKEILADLEP